MKEIESMEHDLKSGGGRGKRGGYDSDEENGGRDDEESGPAWKKKRGENVDTQTEGGEGKKKMKKGGSGGGYRDRAAERRKGINPDYNPSLEEKVSEIEDMEKRRFFGGDVENTHLVSGLDYILLEKMRKKANGEEDEETDGGEEEQQYQEGGKIVEEVQKSKSPSVVVQVTPNDDGDSSAAQSILLPQPRSKVETTQEEKMRLNRDCSLNSVLAKSIHRTLFPTISKDLGNDGEFVGNQFNLLRYKYDLDMYSNQTIPLSLRQSLLSSSSSKSSVTTKTAKVLIQLPEEVYEQLAQVMEKKRGSTKSDRSMDKKIEQDQEEQMKEKEEDVDMFDTTTNETKIQDPTPSFIPPHSIPSHVGGRGSYFFTTDQDKKKEIEKVDLKAYLKPILSKVRHSQKEKRKQTRNEKGKLVQEEEYNDIDQYYVGDEDDEDEEEEEKSKENSKQTTSKKKQKMIKSQT